MKTLKASLLISLLSPVYINSLAAKKDAIAYPQPYSYEKRDNAVKIKAQI